MPRDITVSFSDGTQHIYKDAPDNITPDAALARAKQDFAGKQIANIHGGKGPAPKSTAQNKPKAAPSSDDGGANLFSPNRKTRADATRGVAYGANAEDRRGAQAAAKETVRQGLTREAAGGMAVPFGGTLQGFREIGEGVTDLFGRGLEFLGIGNDQPLSSQITGQSKNAVRRAAETSRRTQLPIVTVPQQTYPNAFAATKLAAQVAGTAPVGGLIAKPLNALAKAAPVVAPYVTPVATAIETGGMTVPKEASWLVKRGLQAVGGATLGGTTAAMINPDDAGSGALIGATVPTVVAPVLKVTASGIGKLIDYVKGRMSSVNAAELLRNAFGADADTVIQILKNAPDDITARQAMVDAGIDADTVFALGEQVEKRNLSGVFSKMAEAADKARKSMMGMVAGGETQEAARIAREGAKDLLTDQTTPMRVRELAAARATNETIPALRQQVGQFSDEATQQVENVRRFTRAGEKAAEAADPFYSIPGMPRTAGKYTYMGELPAQAEARAANAANESLVAGTKARDAAARMADLEAQGLKPIEGEKFSRVIAAKLNDPDVGTNEDVRRALVKISKEINRWINEHGVVDADALYGIRKNAVNAVIDRLSAGRDPSAQKRFASQVISQINPIIDDAIEQAGGKGWRAYLNTFSKGMQEIDRMELVAKAQQLYDQDPKAFLKLVRGNNPQEVEKILGPGTFEIAQEIAGTGKLNVLKRVGEELTRDEQAAIKAAAGAGRLEELLKKNDRFRINFLNRFATVTNEAFDVLQKHVSAKERVALDKAFQSGKNMAEALQVLPAARQAKLLNLLYTRQATPTLVRGAGLSAAQPNVMAAPTDNRNAMAR